MSEIEINVRLHAFEPGIVDVEHIDADFLDVDQDVSLFRANDSVNRCVSILSARR